MLKCLFKKLIGAGPLHTLNSETGWRAGIQCGSWGRELLGLSPAQSLLEQRVSKNPDPRGLWDSRSESQEEEEAGSTDSEKGSDF